ncbi:hypothetical protein [Parabacteroides sp. AF48-14]|uniref:hypothetical protein n=1 Tax=Parabacteroides sp. AF48-14 TaxID=2292052 RepID=UPI0018F2D28F|nr:hypothetical protein [Parabacteroides sp. AF48-14]
MVATRLRLKKVAMERFEHWRLLRLPMDEERRSTKVMTWGVSNISQFSIAESE